MRRALLTAAAAALTGGLVACGPEIITISDTDILLRDQVAGQISSFRYLSSGALATIEIKNRDTSRRYAGIRHLAGGVTLWPLDSAFSYRVTVAGRSFLAWSTDGPARFINGRVSPVDADIFEPLAADGSANGTIALIGRSSNGRTSMVTFSAEGRREFAFRADDTCFLSCAPALGFSTADSFVVTLREDGNRRHLVVMDHDGDPLGGDYWGSIIDSLTLTERFREINDTTLLVYEPSSYSTFASGRVLTLNARGERLSTQVLPPGLSNTSSEFVAYEDGVLIYVPRRVSGDPNLVIYADRPWDWTERGRVEVPAQNYAPVPGRRLLVYSAEDRGLKQFTF